MQIKESLDYGNTKKFSVPIPVLAFFVSLFSMVVMFVIYGYAPFGPLTIWISDLKVQYAPFLSSLRSHLLEGKLTSYSFHTGLGKNSMGLFAYYLSSPFNLLVLLFPASQISQAMAVIIILKMSLASAFMSFFLCVRRQDKSKMSIVFSLLYVFSAYALVYSFNLMWMDAVLLLPLLLAFIEKYLRDRRRWKSLVVVLSIMFLSGYYIAYMAGIFSFIYLVSRSIEGRWLPNCPLDAPLDKQNEFSESTFMAALRYFGCAVLAGMISAFILLPAGLDTIWNSDITRTPPVAALRFSSISILEQFFMGVFIDLSGNMPLIYCGIICVLLLILFFLHPKFSRRSKFVSAGVLLLMFLSFQLSVLDNAWHLFDSPNWFTYRFAFVAVIYIICLSYDAFMMREPLKNKHFLVAGFIFLGMLLLSNTLGSFKVEGTLFYINLLIGLILLFLLWADNREAWHTSIAGLRKYAVYMMVAIIVIEATLLAPMTTRVEALGKSKISVSEYASDYTAISSLYDQAELLSGTDTFYRIETFMDKDHKDSSFSTINSGSLFGHAGTSAFFSMSNKSMFRFMKQLGMDVNYNFFYERQKYSSSLVDSFLGMRYLVSDKDTFTDSEPVSEIVSKGIRLYQNDFAFPIIFPVDSKALSFDFYNLENENSDNNPFEFQNEWFASMIGVAKEDMSPIYYPASASGPDSYNAIESRELNPKEKKELFAFDAPEFEVLNTERSTSINYFRINDNDVMALEYQLTIESDDLLYMQAACPRLSPAIDIFVNDEQISLVEASYYPQILSLGRFEVGDTIDIRIQGQSDTDIFNFSGVYFYYADQDAFVEHSEDLRLLMTPADIRVQDGDVKATLEGHADMTYISTIPYEKGWTLTIDGEPAPIMDYQSAFVAFDLPEGTHEVHLSFKAPGMTEGSVISACGVLLFVLMAGISVIRKNKRDSRK